MDDTWFWRITGAVGRGHITYAPGRLAQEGPFTNPARMVEGLAIDEYGQSEVGVWTYAGWWDHA